MRVTNHKDFACMDYEQNTDSKDIRKLGQIVYKSVELEEEDQKLYGKELEEEIGVIIQIHEDGEYRTDMFGNCCSDELSIATVSQIKRLRSKLLLKL